jgi:putative ABC transport system substrate-binding protein
MGKKISIRLLDSRSDNLKPVLSHAEGSKTCTELSRSIKNLQPEADPPQAEKWLVLSAIAFVLVVAGAVAQAQQPKKVSRIGFLSLNSLSSTATYAAAFRQGLRDFGYVDGKNIFVEWRYADGAADRLPDLVAELVRLKVDVIVTAANAPTLAAKQATSTIPIVIAKHNDPVGAGLVASLARPGGNVTGLSNMQIEIGGKRLELLKEVAKGSRVAVLRIPSAPATPPQMQQMEAAARSLGVQLQPADWEKPEDLEKTFSAMIKGRSDALITFSGPRFGLYRTRIIDLAAKNRLPAMYPDVEYVESGGLMSYGANTADLYRRAATYVDKILKGAKPADLPVEQPTKFEFTST